MIRPPPSSPLFPSTPLSRSEQDGERGDCGQPRRDREVPRQEQDEEAVERVHLPGREGRVGEHGRKRAGEPGVRAGDRKSTRLNSSHSQISYAVFCLKKKKKK